MIFLIATIIIFIMIIFFMPKRLSKIEIYASSLFVLFFQAVTDVYLAFKYELYDYFTKGPDFISWLYVGVYIPVSMIYLTYYPFKKSKLNQALYIIGWSLFSLVYEYFQILSGVFHHTGWIFLYSALYYPPAFLILTLNFLWIRKLIKS